MERRELHTLDILCGVLLIVGGLNWLLVGLFAFNVVSTVFMLPVLIRLVYIAVGIAAIYMLVRMPSLYHIGGRTHTPPQTPPPVI
ncbi:MAG: DUF378 domain-containing protein [Planctomycetaceae bacterium]|nr:MAG: DUF378 domain-containing protein [Planctomycetaceae bacterium]